jgi:bifunctional DNase/RNase
MRTHVTLRQLRFRLSSLGKLLVWGILAPVAIVTACQATLRAREEEHIQVEVQSVGFDQTLNTPVVLLQNKDKSKAIPIWVGMPEAQAIYLQLEGRALPRPMTHDLMKNILEQVGVEFEKVVVSELKESTYYAHIHLIQKGKPLEIDSRPSDAIALALRFHRPIYVAKSLFEASRPAEIASTAGSVTSATIAGVTVQNLTTELAAYFRLPENSGVLVASTTVSGEGETLQRGDVITGVDGEAIHDIEEFRHKLGKGGGTAVTLQVQRDGKERGVRFLPSHQ